MSLMSLDHSSDCLSHIYTHFPLLMIADPKFPSSSLLTLPTHSVDDDIIIIPIA